MTDPQPVRFRPVDEAHADDDVDEASTAGRRETGPSVPTREAERDPYPLAGPIVDAARSRVLRGRCSACEARLRVELGAEQTSPVRVRCPICSNTRSVDL